ncbi:hypothetical protein EAG08_10610 [Chryseobacterium sp. 3008163]|nr:hypothetical protein EAG08_10610 [Chryseobacterium sp. 3008163]
MILFLTGSLIYSQCTVNAGGSVTICGTASTLQGTAGANSSGSPTWTLVSKPSGAPDPVITGVNTLTPNVTGMTFPGNYVFQITQPCTTGPPATSQVTVTAPGDVNTFTAGPDITNVNASVGTVTLNGVIPAGYTAQWSAYNIYTWERSSIKTNTNSQFSSTTTASTTFSLINKVIHEIDPAYVVTLRITSTLNPDCYYEDTAIVRFIPNPQIVLPASTTKCVASGGSHFILLQTGAPVSGSPIFNTGTTGSSGAPGFGTTVTVNPITQPAGANISFSRIYDNSVYFNGVTAVGTYTFTITVNNGAGNYTTPTITYVYSGIPPGNVSFLVASEPDQMMVYNSGASGGEVHCNLAAQTTPITVSFSINPSDPVTITNTVTNSGTPPPGTAPGLSAVSGSGTSANRSFTVTPPTGGWRVGTYKFTVGTNNGTCNPISQVYYIHISDGLRPNVTVNDIAVCYPGSGAVTATVPLPAVYKGAVNTSYLQDFDAQYDFTVVSKPAGSGTPTIPARSLRLFTLSSTQIGNLTTPGEYVFTIKSNPVNSSIGAFLDKEYACSGTSREDTFSIFVTTTVNSNAGSDQSIVGSIATLQGNNTGVATGTWTLVSKPAGAPDPVIVSPTSPNSNVTGLNTVGNYTFRWTVATGVCTTSDDTVVNVADAAPGGVFSAAWYRADAPLTLFSDAGTTPAADNATIQQWKEFNGRPFTLAQATTTLRPQFSSTTTLVNFNPTVNYTTSSKWLQYDGNTLGNIIDRSTGALFSAGNTTGTTAFFGFGTSGAGNTMDDPGLYNFTGNKFLFYPVILDYDPVSTYTINGPYIGGGTWQNGAGAAGNNAVNITLDGFHQTYNTGISNVNTAAGRNALMAGGAETSVAFQQNEMIVFDYKLSDPEVNRVESYLAIKYGKTLSKEQNRNYLSSTGAVVWDGTANNSYYNNVFGIARDNISVMYQKQSRSVNANQKLIIGAGNSLANTNAANTNSLVESQFLLTGDNGLKQSLSIPLSYTAGSNGVTNTRFESIWKVQNTNTVGNVIVAWPKGVTNLYLVQSLDAAFDGTDTFTPMTTEVTVNGVVYNTATVTLGNGQFFTFAGFAQAPGGVTGPDFWVKSDDAGTISTAWKDNSINADNIPNVGGITLSPADRNHNFHPYTSGYTGSKFFYNSSSVMNPLGNVELANTNTSVFSAVRPTTVNGTGRIVGIDDDTNAAEPGFSIASGRPRQYEFFASTTSSDFSVDFNVGQSNIFSALANNTVANGGTSSIAGGEKRLGLNGTYESFSGFSAANRFQIYGTNLRIGQSGWDAGGPFPGDIMEVAWYNRILTANEQSRVNSYLAVKNGVTLNENYLSTNSGVVWDRTNNAGYNNNIFGIAKDDFTALHQKQAGSVNSGQKLVISTTGFANSNAANSTNVVSDLQFLMTGDNGLKQSLSIPLSYTAGSNGVTNTRFESIWKVQNTNTVGNVIVAWPKGVTNLYLVQSLDAAFDGTDTFTPMTTEVTVNGVVYNTATVTLGNGQFFTFAGFAQAPGGVTGPDFWVKSDDAGTISTAWKDNSINADDIPNVGGIALSPADRNHNFHPYTSGYTGSKFFYNSSSVMNPLGNVELPNTNTSVFSAVRPTTVNGTGRIVGIDDDATYAAEPAFSIASGRPRQYEFFASTTSSDFSVDFNVGQSNIFSALANNTVANGGTSAIAGGEKRLGLNGSYESFSGFAATNRFQIYGRNLRIGEAGWDAGAPFPGDIMEVAWYNRTLTANEQSRVNSYLAVKNGVTLNENYLSTISTVVWDRTINTGYNNNIFGIAKDDFTALHQKQAGSVNSGQKLVISTTGFANSNATNSTNVISDLQFLMTGDNGLRQSLTTPLSYTAGSNGIANYRFESIWKVQNTNNVGTVTVAWPKSVKNLYLVQSPDSGFDATDTFTPMTTEVTVNGVVYNTVNVTLGNGQFFTFAGFGNAPGGVASNLSYWYRADKNATNTGATTDVTGWTDMWNGTTVSQRVTNALPKYAVGTSSYFNFNPGINFTAINQTLGNITTQTVTNTSNDIFTVTKEGMTSSGSPTPHFLSIGMDNVNTTISNWDYTGFTPAGTNIERRVVGGGTQFVNSAVNFSTTIPSIMYNTFTNTTLARGLNGAANGTTANYTAVGLALGGHIFGDTRWTGSGSDNGGFIGNLGETIIYGAGNLTTTERRRVDSYLAIKYGITMGRVDTEHYLDTDGTIVWNGASNITYNNNIFGVSRDDIEVFEQKVSKSVNTGTILTVATTNDFVNPNQDVARTGFANDKTYFLLGDNNVTVTPLVDITVAGNTYKRIQRAWMAQEKKSDAGSLFFEANLSAYNLALPATDGNVVMLVADDANFTTNVQAINPLSNNSGKYIYNQNIADGKYITFATYWIDTDGDGVIDACDLDDDNDGILDVNERSCELTGQTIRIGYIPDSRATASADSGYTFDGQYMNNSGALKLTNPANFGPAGTVKATIVLVNMGTAPITKNIINSLNLNAIFLGGIDNVVTSYLSASEFDAIKDWSAESSNNFVVSTQVQTKPWGATTVAGNVNPDIPTPYGSQTPIFNGPFGNITSFNQGGSYQGYFTNIVSPCNTGALATDQNNNPVISLDGNYNDLMIADVDILTTIGGVTNGNAITSNNDKLFANIWAFVVQQSACTSKDTDGDGIPNHLDLDSDNDGCLDALEGSANFVVGDLVPAGGTVTVGFGSTALIKNLCGGITCVGANGIPTIAGAGQGIGSSQNIAINGCQTACYKPGITAGTALDTKVGITSLNRAGATDSDNWPMTRKGGWLALEAKTKGFVPNRVAFSAGNPVGIAPANFVEGMMVYDTTNKCMKIYTLKEGDSSMAWHCITTQTCPD